MTCDILVAGGADPAFGVANGGADTLFPRPRWLVSLAATRT